MDDEPVIKRDSTFPLFSRHFSVPAPSRRPIPRTLSTTSKPCADRWRTSLTPSRSASTSKSPTPRIYRPSARRSTSISSPALNFPPRTSAPLSRSSTSSAAARPSNSQNPSRPRSRPCAPSISRMRPPPSRRWRKISRNFTRTPTITATTTAGRSRASRISIRRWRRPSSLRIS